MSRWPEDRKHFFFTGGTACPGCGSLLAQKLALDTIYNSTKDAIVMGRACPATADIIVRGVGLGYVGSGMTGLEVAARLRGIDKHIVTIEGEGRLFDAAFDDFCGVFERKQKVTYIVLDNQGFSSTGNHQTSATPFKVRTSMFRRGKPRPAKNVAMMMIFGGARYVATASTAFVDDYIRKVRLALDNTPSLVQVICPCVQNWGYESEEMVNIGRKAVTSGFFPIWEWHDGIFTRTVKRSKRTPLNEFLALQRRYAHLTGEDVDELQAQVDTVNRWVDGMERAFSVEQRECQKSA